MTIYFQTGFEGCGDEYDCKALICDNTVYSYFGYFEYQSSAGLGGGKCIRARNGYGGSKGLRFRKNLPSAAIGKTLAVGFHANDGGYGFSTSDNYAGAIIGFGGPEIYITNESTCMRVFRGTTQIASISGGQYGLGQFHHFEAILFSDASAGTLTIKVDGKTIYSGSSLNTGGSDITALQFSNPYGETSRYYDNIYIADALQGELHMKLYSPAADDSCDFTPSTGSDNYAMVDDTAPDGDTTYNESSTLNHADLFEYEDMAGEELDGSIAAVSIVTIAKKLDAGDRAITHITEQDATGYDHTEFYLTTDYVEGEGAFTSLAYEVLNTAPDSTSWTPAKFNALKIGYEITI